MVLVCLVVRSLIIWVGGVEVNSSSGLSAMEDGIDFILAAELSLSWHSPDLVLVASAF